MTAKRDRRLCVVLVALCIAVSVAYAGRLFRRSLEEMIGETEAIVVARVQSASELTEESDRQAFFIRKRHYRIVISEVLVGSVRTNTLEAFIVARYPGRAGVRTGKSGIELKLRKGHEYLFLLGSVNMTNGTASVARVEQMERRERVIEAWRERQKASQRMPAASPKRPASPVTERKVAWGGRVDGLQAGSARLT